MSCKNIRLLILVWLACLCHARAHAIHHYALEGELLVANSLHELNQARCHIYEELHFSYPSSVCIGGKRTSISVQQKWISLLVQKEGEDLGLPLPPLDSHLARLLLKRLHEMKLFAHSFPFDNSLSHAGFTLYQFIDFVASHGLAGASIHESYLEFPYKSEHEKRMELRRFADYAKAHSLELTLEASNTDQVTVQRLLEKAQLVGAAKVRVYIRKEGWLKKEILPAAIAELKIAAALAQAAHIDLMLEQHEDIKSQEIVEVVQAVNAAFDKPVLSILFDTANSVSAYERPLRALAIQAPYISAVHLKDARITKVVDRSYPHNPRVGWAQVGTLSGDGDLNLIKHIFDLLMQGVTIFACQESYGFADIAYRFAEEESDADVFIPARGPSYIELEATDLPSIAEKEQSMAAGQYRYIRSLLHQLKELALEVLPKEEQKAWQAKPLP